MELIFATNNAHKVTEMQAAIGDAFKVLSLSEAGINIEIPEPFDTLSANASEKSRAILGLTGRDCFSEDSGLEVDALQGEPGVRSARYAGDDADAARNMGKLLEKIATVKDRKARFRTVISLRLAGNEQLFEGVCEGRITEQPAGTGGFGYDPIFVPDGGLHTFGEMTLDEKSRFSHRRKACDKLVIFLQQFRTAGQGHAKTIK